MIAWQVIDPLQRRVELFPLEEPLEESDDSKIRPELEHCESHHNNVWLSVIFAYKGLVLVSFFNGPVTIFETIVLAVWTVPRLRN